MSETFLVLHSAVLGPPLTDRTYLAGELISAEDFLACPEQIARLEKFQAIRPALPHEYAQALAERERNLRDHLGLPSNAAAQDAEEIARLRREGQRQALAEMQRRQALLGGPQNASLTASGVFVAATQAAAAAPAVDPFTDEIGEEVDPFTEETSEPVAAHASERRRHRKGEG